MPQNSQFSRFMVVFMSYFPPFYGSRAIYNNLKTRYMFESYDQKVVVFVFFGHFLTTKEASGFLACLSLFRLYNNTFLFFPFLNDLFTLEEEKESAGGVGQREGEKQTPH